MKRKQRKVKYLPRIMDVIEARNRVSGPMKASKHASKKKARLVDKQAIMEGIDNE